MRGVPVDGGLRLRLITKGDPPALPGRQWQFDNTGVAGDAHGRNSGS
jgi:hypothetical protein